MDSDARAVQFDYETYLACGEKRVGSTTTFGVGNSVSSGSLVQTQSDTVQKNHLNTHALGAEVVNSHNETQPGYVEKQVGSTIVPVGDACLSGSLVRTQAYTVHSYDSNTYDFTPDLALQDLVVVV